MSIKEQLVDLVRAQGFDFMTACELVTTCLREFKESGARSKTYIVGRAQFTLNRVVEE